MPDETGTVEGLPTSFWKILHFFPRIHRGIAMVLRAYIKRQKIQKDRHTIAGYVRAECVTFLLFDAISCEKGIVMQIERCADDSFTRRSERKQIRVRERLKKANSCASQKMSRVVYYAGVYHGAVPF